VTDKPNPMATAQRLARRETPRRFYKKAEAGTLGEAFAVLLDGKVAKTPGRKPLAVPQRPLAEALAAEWEAQGERLEPASMPLTRIVNAAIDRVAGEIAAVRADVVKYAGTDLICYRAEGPQSLVDTQEAAWSPIIGWARQALGARFILAAGIVHVKQNASALTAIDHVLRPLDALSLAALHTVTTLTGSVVIALALHRGQLSVEEAWVAAHIDEDWQMAQWGKDDAALARRAFRWREMVAAALILKSS
jgi:chaperone required for assembly of F1-ATPase